MKNSTPLIVLLSLFPTLALAQGSEAGFTSFIPLVVLVVVFYFLLIRPQQKRAKSHKALLSDLKKGDEILTNGGVLAKVTQVDVDDTFATIEIAPGVEVKVQKQAINQRMPKGTVDSPKQKTLPKPKKSAKKKDNSAKKEDSAKQKEEPPKQKEEPPKQKSKATKKEDSAK